MEPETQQKLTEALIKATVKIAIDITKSFGKKFKDEITIENAMTEYAMSYINRHGHVKVLGMSKPVPLYGLYTDVEIVDSSRRRNFESIESLEYMYRGSASDQKVIPIDLTKRRDAIKLANKEQFLNVLGAPGSGKTTFLRRIGLEALLPRKSWTMPSFEVNEYLSRYEHETLPVYIELRRFKTEDINLFKLIQNEFEVFGFPETHNFIDKALKKGRLLLLLDGLDEVPKDRLDIVINHIRDFTDKYDKNRYITSCRIAFYKTYFTKYTDVEIAAFSDVQIKTFARNWFLSGDYLDGVTSEEFILQLFGDKQLSTLELARTPLLLTFLCLVFDESQKLPSNRASLYRRALMILLERWSAEKRVHNDPIYKEFHSDLEIEMLAVISAKAYENEKIFFNDTEILKLINDFLQDSLGEPKSVNGRKVLEAIEIQQGLLVQRVEGVYSFSHLTIQEYLTAYYFSAPGRVKELSSSKLYESRWREIFLLLSGMPQSDTILETIFQTNQELISQSKHLSDILNWVNDVTLQVENEEESFCRRLFALCLPLRFRRPDTDSGRSINSLTEDADVLIKTLNNRLGTFRWNESLYLRSANQLLDAISAMEIFNFNLMEVKKSVIDVGVMPKGALYGTRFKYTVSYLSPLFKSLGLKRDLQMITTNEASKPILNYIYGCIMIFQCKDAALRVSKSSWSRILNGMIRPNTNCKI